jgi:hypothetical protein
MMKTGSSALMCVKSIFQQLHNPTTWPAPPERPLRPYNADLRPGVQGPPHAGGDPAAMDGGREGGETDHVAHPSQRGTGAGPNVCTIWSGFMMWMIANEMILIMLLGVPNED